MPGRARQIETDPIRELYAKIADLQAEVRELRAGRRLEAAAIGQGGITIKDGGAVRVIGDDGLPLATIGDLSNVIGGGVHGVWFGRAGTNATAMAVYGTGAEGDSGFVGIYDLNGNYIVTDDTESKRGLARPYIPLSVGEITVPTATTTSGSFTDLFSGGNAFQHPVLYADLLVRASDASTAGEVRLAVNGTAVGPVTVVAAGSYTFAGIGPFALPASAAGNYGTIRTLTVQARRTAGTGTIGVRVNSILGLESSYA